MFWDTPYVIITFFWVCYIVKKLINNRKFDLCRLFLDIRGKWKLGTGTHFSPIQLFLLPLSARCKTPGAFRCFNHHDLHPCVEQAGVGSKKSGGFIKLFMRRGISVMIGEIKPATKISTSYHLAEKATFPNPLNADLLKLGFTFPVPYLMKLGTDTHFSP